MNRQTFLQMLAGMPLLGVPFRAWGNVCRTQRDAEGPFYKSAAPFRVQIEDDGEGLEISGIVRSASDCRSPVANAVIDIWHCDSHGAYDMKGFRCRGMVETNAAGKYAFKTILPPPYGSRPRHIHIKVRAKGYPELTTQLYFDGDPNIVNDFARNAEPDRVIRLTREHGIRTGVFDIYL